MKQCSYEVDDRTRFVCYYHLVDIYVHKKYFAMKAIFPDDKKIEYPEQSILTIYLSSEKISFSLYEPGKKGSFFYNELTPENHTDPFSIFKDTFFDHAFFYLPFKKVWVMSCTPVFTFVPDLVYKEDLREDFMHFMFPENRGITLNHSIPSLGINVLYRLSTDVYSFMLRSFNEPEFIHYSSPLITYFLEKVKTSDISRMVVNLKEKGLDIFCFSGKTFLLGNYFPCNDLAEAVYYILFTWKQLQFNQLKDYLHIAGNAAFKDELINKLTPYLDNIYSLSIFPEIHLEGVETNKVPFELAALSLCEL